MAPGEGLGLFESGVPESLVDVGIREHFLQVATKGLAIAHVGQERRSAVLHKIGDTAGISAHDRQT